MFSHHIIDEYRSVTILSPPPHIKLYRAQIYRLLDVPPTIVAYSAAIVLPTPPPINDEPPDVMFPLPAPINALTLPLSALLLRQPAIIE